MIFLTIEKKCRHIVGQSKTRHDQYIYLYDIHGTEWNRMEHFRY